jgi:hypothetical protein
MISTIIGKWLCHVVIVLLERFTSILFLNIHIFIKPKYIIPLTLSLSVCVSLSLSLTHTHTNTRRFGIMHSLNLLFPRPEPPVLKPAAAASDEEAHKGRGGSGALSACSRLFSSRSSREGRGGGGLSLLAETTAAAAERDEGKENKNKNERERKSKSEQEDEDEVVAADEDPDFMEASLPKQQVSTCVCAPPHLCTHAITCLYFSA